MTTDCIDLARALIRFPSLNPPGDEAPCVDWLAGLLSDAGMTVARHEFAPGRPSIVARIPGAGAGRPLCFTGHLDVVPLGAAAWTVDPFAGEIRDGRLFGRGASDMKGGVAAFVAATCDALREDQSFARGISLVITAGEETGCEGAFHLARIGALGEAALLVVAEPSRNLPVLAHKGSMRIRVTATGRTAHSSMPALGENAVCRVAEWILRLDGLDYLAAPHPLLGTSTAAVTTVTGGSNINSIPDAASFTVDFRTIPDEDHAALLGRVHRLFGPGAAIDLLTDFPGFSTDPEAAAIRPLMAILTKRLGAPPQATGAPYFTDASALVPGFGGVPTVVLGPGEPDQCHRTDEFCFAQNILDARDIYRGLIEDVCR